MKKKLFGIVFALCSVLLLSAGCGGEKQADANVDTSKPQEPGLLVVNADYTVPPTAQGNPFIGGYVGGSIDSWMQDSLFVFAPFPEKTFKAHLGESFTMDGKTLNLKLKDGLKWSDGTSLTTKDVVTTINMSVGRNQIWNYLESMEVVDDTNMKFHFVTDSELVPNILFTIKINAADANYHEWAEKYSKIGYSGREMNTDGNYYQFTEEAQTQLTKLNAELEEYKVELKDVMCSGPFTLDKITTSEILMNRNDNYYANLDIEKLKVLRVITPETAANAMENGSLDIHMGGMVSDVEKQLSEKIADYEVNYISEMSEMSMVFNTTKYPANTKEFRQAIAFLTNREELFPLTEPGSVMSETYCSGLPLTLQESFSLVDYAKDELTDYAFNEGKAIERLESIGWKRNDAGKWVDDKGKVVSFEIACNNGWASAMLPGEAISSRLNEFGFDVTFKPMEASAYFDYVGKGDHTIMIELAPAGSTFYAHPYSSYESLFKGRYGWMGLEPNKAGDVIIKSENKDYNVTEMVDRLFTSSDEEVLQITKDLMKINNEEVFIVPYLEKGLPLRSLKTFVRTGFENGELIMDPKFSGGGDDIIQNAVKEQTFTLPKE